MNNNIEIKYIMEVQIFNKEDKLLFKATFESEYMYPVLEYLHVLFSSNKNYEYIKIYKIKDIG